MQNWKTYLQTHCDRHLQELIDFLRIPSISSLASHAQDVDRAAEWTAEKLKAAGMEAVGVHPTGGHPVVTGEWCHAPGRPTVMVYGHFDVQPVDPLALWSNPPFEPALKDGRIYARGASDDKGNMLIPILAAEAMLKSGGALPVNLKFFFEGQEEIGSPQLPEFIAANKKMLACDVVVSADGGQWMEEQPALLVGLRGLCSLQIDVKAAGSDLHSGTYGGTVANPIHALARIIESMHDPEGRIRVGGFYDEVRPLTKSDRNQMGAVPFDEADYKSEIGVSTLIGEPGFSTYERAWARPTLEVNGIWGGFQEEGIKTVLPSRAHAKITCRLVPDQVPEAVFERVARHIERHRPPGVQVAVRPLDSRADPYLMPLNHPGNLAARQVLHRIYGKAPYIVRMGGTIPVCAILLAQLGVYTVNFAFGLRDENAHAPDEFFRLSGFERGKEAYGMLLTELSMTKW